MRTYSFPDRIYEYSTQLTQPSVREEYVLTRKKRKASIGAKLRGFIIAVVLIAVMGTAIVAYFINAHNTDQFYKSTTMNTAANVASVLDPDFIRDLQMALNTDEYQQLRVRAETENNEEIIADYLKNAGLYEKYLETIKLLRSFWENMDGLYVIYIISCSADSPDYFYFMSAAPEFRLFHTGLPDVMESEFAGVSLSNNRVEPIISNSSWGWLCSAYAKICDVGDGNSCFVGTDISMNDVMRDRNRFLLISAVGALAFSFLVLLAAVPLMNKTVIRPLVTITKKMKDFTPAENTDYEKAGVISLDLKSGDEIQDIYDGIRTMQVNIIDYLNHMSALQREREKAYIDMREKDEKIDEISRDAYRDALTGVGSPAAFKIAQDEMKKQMSEGFRDFAVLMMDINNLKHINDTCGHKSGDLYIRGCCRMLCREFRNSRVFRIGGDEFTAILTGEDYRNRLQHMTKLREAYARSAAGHSSAPWQNYSAAVGSSSCHPDDKTFEDVFKRADSDMYVDKNACRQRK